jgi:hypothetical protein
MQLKSAPDACPSINVAGTEYTPGPDGTVTIDRDEHIEIAKANGFTEVAENSTQPTGE